MAEAEAALTGASSGEGGTSGVPRGPLQLSALRDSSDSPSAEPLYARKLSDGHRVGVLLQLASVMAHAQLRGLSLDGMDQELPLSSSVLDSGNRLSGVLLTESVGSETTQAVLERVALGLFGAQSKVAGRGQARKAMRTLLASWEEKLMEQPAAGQVGRILRAAPFLWNKTYRHHRAALAGVHHRQQVHQEEPLDPVRTYLWVLGGAAFRERTLARSTDLHELTQLLMSDRVKTLWRGRPLETASKAALAPSDLLVLGRWGAALARWRKSPPETPLEELAMAECLYCLGQFDEAAEIVRARGAHRPDAKGRQSLNWTLVWAKCALQNGQFVVASRAVAVLVKRKADWPSLSTRDRFDLLDTAVRVHANLGQPDGVRRWLQFALQWKGKDRAFGRLIAAEACLDLGEPDAARKHLENAVSIDPEIVEDWHYQLALSSYFVSLQNPIGIDQAVTAALTLGRRSMRVFEAGKAWSELILARGMLHDLAGAERACRQALRLHRKCDGSSRSTLIQANFAEVRIRRGRFDGVSEIVVRAAQDGALSGNRRGAAMDLSLEGRFRMARGELVRAESLFRACLDALDKLGWEGARAETEILLARCLAWLGRPKAARKVLLEACSHDVAVVESVKPPRRTIEFERLQKGVLEPEELSPLLLQVGEFEAADAASVNVDSRCLWQPLVAAGGLRRVPVSVEEWKAAGEGLEGYRAARLVFDALLCGAEFEEEVLKMASDELRESGAPWMANCVEGARDDGWHAVLLFLEAARGGLEVEPAEGMSVEEALRSLFLSAGAPGVRIEFSDAGESRTLVVGPGGDHELELELQSGHVRFSLPRLDDRLRSIAMLVVATLDGRALPSEVLGRRGVVDISANKLPPGVVGESEQLVSAFSDLRRLAASEMALLVLGETGTGKESAARAVHDASPRSARPFLPLNCAALDQNLALSDLFGHIKGAFTGADKNREGVFEAAKGGTVFLDEIGDLSLGAQGLLLRVLQEKEVRRLGESEARPVDARVVAATHRDLEAEVRQGTFREDLLYRLNTGVVTLPPLRVRGRDSLLLAEHFCRQFGPERTLSAGAKSAILSFTWPGNVRQLMSHVQRASALAEGDLIEASHLSLPDAEPLTGWHEWLETLKKERLVLELRRHDGNQSATARSLGLSRQALSYLVRQLGLL